jgi:hypothetical protein
VRYSSPCQEVEEDSNAEPLGKDSQEVESPEEGTQDISSSGEEEEQVLLDHFAHEKQPSRWD